MWKTLLFILALGFTTPADAAIFDASDILPKNSGALGAAGELLLSDPSSEGVEAHGRYGLSNDWNVGAVLGTGSKNKKFRLGGEGVYNLLPDWEGQLGLSFLGSILYLQRPGGGGLQMRVGPMVHKRITSWSSLPATMYIAVPWYLEARGGTYTTATQLVLGSVFDVSESGHYYFSAEAGIRLAKADSYVLFGAGVRLGDIKFRSRETAPEGGTPRKGKASGRHTRDPDKELTDEDFDK